MGLNKTRISIARLSGGGPYQLVVDVHGQAPVTTDELLSILTAIWGPETAGEVKQLILDETGLFEAEAALPVWPIIRLLSVLNANETPVSSREIVPRRAAKLVLSDEPIEIARKRREMTERTIRPTK